MPPPLAADWQATLDRNRQEKPSSYFHDKVLQFERERLLNSVRRIALMTHERSHGFKYVLTSGQLELSVSNPDMGEARELVARPKPLSTMPSR